MKRVFGSHSQCAHVWAQQSQDRGEAKNVYFAGTAFYSWATPIANFVTDKFGDKVVLIYRGSHSSSSGKHRHHAVDAVSHYEHYFVDHIGIEGGWSPRTDGADFHALNAVTLLDEYQREVSKQRRGYGDGEARLRKLALDATNYVERFNVLDMVVPNVDADVADIATRTAARNTPEAIAKREKAAKAREARQALLAQDRESKWRRGELRTLDRDYHEGALLRVRGDNIETSRGARFPVEHGRRAFPLIARVKEAGQGYQRNGHTIHLGMFAIDRIDTAGNVTAGCHYVTFDEITRMARTLGLLPPEPPAQGDQEAQEAA